MNWFKSCMSIKLRKKDMNSETLKSIANGFPIVHFYTNYTTNVVILIGDSKEVSDAIDTIRYKAQSRYGDIITSAYSIIDITGAYGVEKK